MMIYITLPWDSMIDGVRRVTANLLIMIGMVI